MSPDSRPQPRSLAEFQLEREAAEAFGLLPAWYFDYLQPYLGATTSNDWNNFSVHKEGGGGNDVSDDSGKSLIAQAIPMSNFLNYATSLPKQTYQVLNAKLLNPDGRRITEMRLHEMIQSTWATESDTELTRLGIRQIENADARRAILCEYERAASTAIKNEFLSAISQGANPAGLTVTISGEGVLSPYWNDNPFIRTAVGVAGDAYKVTAHLIKEDISNMPRMYMVMELDGAREGQTGLEGLEECPQDPRS